jgi:hypothetical protein
MPEMSQIRNTNATLLTARSGIILLEKCKITHLVNEVHISKKNPVGLTVLTNSVNVLCFEPVETNLPIYNVLFL